MSYGSMYQCAGDVAFLGRVTACCAQEGATDPPAVAGAIIWDVVSASDIAAAYESALLSGNPNPGGDEAVITDGMILANVQAHKPFPEVVP